MSVRLAENLSESHSARITRVVPAASEELPSQALGSAGGGEMPVDPTDPEGLRAMRSLFEVELELGDEVPLLNVGGRAYVRFEHGSEPLALQWTRRLRQLFLSRFRV